MEDSFVKEEKMAFKDISKSQNTLDFFYLSQLWLNIKWNWITKFQSIQFCVGISFTITTQSKRRFKFFGKAILPEAIRAYKRSHHIGWLKNFFWKSLSFSYKFQGIENILKYLLSLNISNMIINMIANMITQHWSSRSTS